LTQPSPVAVALRRRGTGGASLGLVTIVASVFVGLAVVALASPPTGGTDLFFLAVAAVPGGLAVALWHQHLTPQPRLRLDTEGLVVEDALTLADPLRVPWEEVAEVRVGAAVDERLAATVGSVIGLPVPRSLEHGLDVGPAAPNLLLAFEPPIVPVRARRTLTGRGTRTMTPATGMPIERLWLAAEDPIAAAAAFAAMGHPPEEGD